MREEQQQPRVLIKYICDICESYCYIYRNDRSPPGWCTTKEDHSNLVCAECNPWMKRTTKPDPIKLKIANSLNLDLGSTVSTQVKNPRLENGPDGYPKNNPAFDKAAAKVLHKRRKDAEKAEKFLEGLAKPTRKK